MTIHDIFDRDPRTSRLPNGGQAQIKAGQRASVELRGELETFVCEGQFAHTIQLILDRYFGGLDRSRQESAWVSGFFGSGKSHLLKMLTHLWINTTFEDGASARTLVPGGLPQEIEAQLRELDTHARRNGKAPIAAAGTMLGGSVDYVRATVLAIILEACDFPRQYPQAMFCFWLRQEGLLEQVQNHVAQANRDWVGELNNLYVSPHIAAALLAANPSLAEDEPGVHEILRQQYPGLTTDISTPQFIDAARKALSPNKDLPHTLVVLDEVQQYIQEHGDRAATFTEIAETMQTQFDGRVMLVAAGQSALSGSTQGLMWLRDRFRIHLQLNDADVEAVTRSVVLGKKPSAIPEIDALFDDHAGEVARHLQGTKVGARAEDSDDWARDYPLLPVRRRFWEVCFRDVDAAGTQSALRSQLRILHDSLHELANHDLGAVIPASDLFDALADDLVNTGVLSNELNTRIQKLDDGTPDGNLRHDLCGLVFLIGRLPRKIELDLGIRATAGMLADLLLDDVTADSGAFRARIADMLAALAAEGVLMQVGDEYRLQTTEGAEWEQAFHERQAALRQDEPTTAHAREQLFGQIAQETVSGIRLNHGEAKLRRNIKIHLGNEPPGESRDDVVVWFRDGWSCSQKEVESEARQLGQTDAVIHVYVPLVSAGELGSGIIDVEAARQVLDRHGTPTSPEGLEAMQSMASRLQIAENARDGILQEIFRSAKAYLGGGTEIFGEDLGSKITEGTTSALARLFPRFQEGDHRRWELAVKRARDGSDQPLQIVEWGEATEEHAVAKEVLTACTAGALGSVIQRNLKSAPYGWPQDAIDAVLIALHRSGHVAAKRNGDPIKVGALDQAGVKSAEFRPQKIRLTTPQRIALRGLFDKAGVPTPSGEEEARASEFLHSLLNLAKRVGGAPPLPAPPETTLITELGSLSSTEQLAAILEATEELEASIARWGTLDKLAVSRQQTWGMAGTFRRHAAGLLVLDEVGSELDAIESQRSLLDDSDQISPLLSKLAGALRDAVTTRHNGLAAVTNDAILGLGQDATWAELAKSDQDRLLDQAGLRHPEPLSIAEDSALKRSLNERSLPAWQAEIDAVPTRINSALRAATALLAQKDPKRSASEVQVRRGTLADESAVRDWLSEHEQKLLKAITAGPVILL